MRSIAKLALCIASLVLGACIAPGGIGAQSSKRPNILFIFADDWGRYASAYAKVDGLGGINDVVRTPNFDSVVQRGVLFRNAFVNAPSCTPSRSALLSGQYFRRTGRGAILRGDDRRTLPRAPRLLRHGLGRTVRSWCRRSAEDSGGESPACRSRRRTNQECSFSQNAGEPCNELRGVASSVTRSLWHPLFFHPSTSPTSGTGKMIR